MFAASNFLIFFTFLACLVTLGKPDPIRDQPFSRTRQTPETLSPVGRRSNTNSFKFDSNDFNKSLSKLVSSNLHGFQYEVHFPPHKEFKKQSDQRNDVKEVDVVGASAASQVASVLPPGRNMEIRPSHAQDQSQQLYAEEVKEGDLPEFVGYVYDAPPTASLEPTTPIICHQDVEHPTSATPCHSSHDGYVYDSPSVEAELDEGGNNNTRALLQPSASNQEQVIQAQLNPEFPNYSSVKFRSSFFGEDGLPRVVTDEEEDKIPLEYNFAYTIRGEAELGHEESLQDEVTRGTYHVLLPDGRLQYIQYEADAEGFRPVIRYHKASQLV